MRFARRISLVKEHASPAAGRRSLAAGALLSRFLPPAGLLALVSLAFIASPVQAAKIPQVDLHAHSPGLKYLMYPEFYRTPHDAEADSVWPDSQLPDVVAHWEEKGERMLRLVSELSGVKWYEKRLDLYLVEETPNWGAWDPLVLPVDNWRRGDLVRLAPRGPARSFVLAHLLAQRLFAQVPPGKEPDAFAHPLFRSGLGTRDNLANLVAYWTVAELAGEEVAFGIITADFMTREAPNLEMVATRFLPGWRLTEERPLVVWVEEEPEDSDLVRDALSYRESLGVGPVEGRFPGRVERSRIGLRVRNNVYGDVVVVAVEEGKLADAASLRAGDVLIRVGGVAVENSRDVMLRLIALLRGRGVTTLMVEREGELHEIFMNLSWLRGRG